ncbi:hypothetical protein IT575_00460 [bacterium]|nr:hypothetical protein [bacterium]
MNKSFLLLSILLVFCLLQLSSCGSSGEANPNNNVEQTLTLDDRAPGGTAIVLNLRGPNSGTSTALTYYVFGSNESLGDKTIIPLAPLRKDEQSFGPYAFGETASDIDLSPWAGYQYIYVRCNPAVPQYIFLLKPGHTYTFSST